MAPPVLHLSSVVRSPLLDRGGERLGRVRDVIVRVTDEGVSPVTGLEARIGARDLFVSIEQVAELAERGVRLAGESFNLRRFDRRPGEVLLRHDVLGRKLVHVEAAQLVTAHDIDLMCIDGRWRVAGIDAGARGLLRRLLPRRLASDVDERSFIDWSELEPFMAHVPAARLKLRHRKLARLHPAQIADLVEAASHDEGEEIIKAVGQDRELEADVFEELDDEHQLEFIRERADAEVAAVLARMGADDAADLVVELPDERRQRILALMPPLEQRDLLRLLGYSPETAGGIMGTDFVAVPESLTVADALEHVRASDIPPEALGGVYALGDSGQLSGWISLVELVRAERDARVRDVAEADLPTVDPDTDLREVARLVTDFNLTMLPVVDDERRLGGVITVDDVLELTLPTGWRRRYGVVGR